MTMINPMLFQAKTIFLMIWGAKRIIHRLNVALSATLKSGWITGRGCVKNVKIEKQPNEPSKERN